MKRKNKILFASVLAVSLFAIATLPALAKGSPINIENYENIFGEIYQYILTYSAEIFSFLSLIGTIVISRLYKRGLIPSVKSALSSIGGAVGKIKESSDKVCENQAEDTRVMAERLQLLDGAIQRLDEKCDELSSRLLTEEKFIKQKEKSDLILKEQIDLLYDIFMTSSLPHYQKEATGERINKMRKELDNYENT